MPVAVVAGKRDASRLITSPALPKPDLGDQTALENRNRPSLMVPTSRDHLDDSNPLPPPSASEQGRAIDQRYCRLGALLMQANCPAGTGAHNVGQTLLDAPSSPGLPSWPARST